MRSPSIDCEVKSDKNQPGIDKDYINAFQGRIPQSVLAKHYTDY